MTNSIDNGEVRLRSDALDWLDVDGEIVILDANKSVYMSINHSGADLWRLLEKGATISDLAQSLVATYAIDADRAAHDVEQFLGVLREHDLIEGS